MRQVQFKDFEALKGLHNAIRVRAATTANITVSTALNAGDTLDGVTLAAGDAVLVKDQSTASGNGIYIVAADPYRHPDFSAAERNNAAAYDTHAGLTVTVMEGTTNADTMWVCTSNKGGVLGTGNIVFSAKRSFSQGYRITAAASKTIASGAITITQAGRVVVDTESAAATDDLDTISGGEDGDVIIVFGTSAARVVTVKDGTGNLRTAGDIALDNPLDNITLLYSGAGTVWIEIARSNNA